MKGARRRRRVASSRRRRLGQHFLVHRRAIERVVQAVSPAPGQRFLEVGPGRGALTLPLCDAGARILAVELDGALAQLLREKGAAAEALRVVQGDILKVDLDAIVSETFPEGGPIRVVGNLPYSVASPALHRLLARPDLFRDWTLMVQKEVADRILAAPGSRLFGVMTLLCAVRATSRRLLDLPPSCFSPPPEVHSTLLHFVPRAELLASETEMAAFRSVVKAAFASRRKMLRNTLAASLRLEAETIEGVLRAAGLRGEDRPERIPLEGYVELSRRLASFL
jgi:16S rRNA (adenine1518-N6/adenine1519-N6)-dimethyltransferase